MRAPLFLARAVYRRRRLRDAARLLPLIGALLLMLPALGRAGNSGARDAIYVFAVWALLIVAAAALAPGLAAPDPDTGPEDDSRPEDD